MADIAAGDVTYSIDKEFVLADLPLRVKRVAITFGDGSDTYPTGGVPLTFSSMGINNEVVAFLLEEADAGNGFVYKFDRSAETIRVYQGDNDNASDGPLVELAGGSATPAEATVTALVIGW